MSDYVDWADLLDDESDETDISPDSSMPEDKKSLSDLLHLDQVSDELKELITQHQTLEHEMDQLLGRSKGEEKNWDNIRFPMPKHTVKSRLKDRKKLHQELLLAEKNKKRLESVKLKRKQIEKQLTQAKELKQRRLSLQKIELQKKQKRQLALDELKRSILNKRLLAKKHHEQRSIEEQQNKEQRNRMARQREIAEQKKLDAQKKLAIQAALLKKDQLCEYLNRDACNKKHNSKEESALDELETRQQQAQKRITARQKEARSLALQEKKRQARALQRQEDRRNEQARWGI